MKSIKPLIAAIIVLAAGTALACKCVEFKDAVATMATPTLGGAYVTFVSDKDDTLTGLSSPCCDAVELHRMSKENGVMSMRKLDSLPLKSGVPVILGEHRGDSESMHLMLIGVHKAMKPGQKFPVTFTFAKEKPHTATFTVAKRGAKTTGTGAAGHAH